MMYAILFLAGMLLGSVGAFSFSKHSKPFRDLQKKLSEKEAELARYQDHVAEHFQKTAELFSELQVRQDILVRHLQDGAKRLRNDMLPPREELDLVEYEGHLQ